MKEPKEKKNRSIKTKLTFIIMVVSAFAIFLTSFASVIYNFKRFDSDFSKEFESITGIIGFNMSAALEFEDKQIGKQILDTLRSNNKVLAAYIYKPNGEMFSEYKRYAYLPVMNEERLNNDTDINKNFKVFKRNIVLENKNIGKIYLLADVQELRNSYINYLMVVTLILLLTLIVVYFISIYFQRFISNPIFNLSKLVKDISYEKNYSVRAIKQSNDEIGYLVDKFNEMLEQIQHRDEALIEAQEELEKRVAERTIELKNEISERERISEILRESQQMLSLVMNNIPQAIFWKDKNFKYLGCNTTFAQHAGIENTDDIVGKTDFDLPWEKSEIQKFFESESKVIIDGNPIYKEIQTLRHANSKKSIIEINRVPLYDSKNYIMGILGTYEDITERRQLEDELIKTQKLDSLGILAGGIAHDFNNLLTGILGNITFASSKLNTGEDITNYLKKAEMASLRAKDLTKQLLTFAKGGQPIKKAVNLSDLLVQTVSLSLRGSKIKCEYELDENLWLVEIDEGQISQVINNLVINADQSMPAGGVIKIQANNLDNNNGNIGMLKKGKYIHIKIKDSGIGISDENIKKIFDPYFTTKDHGSGLGLATSYSVIKNHGGLIEVTSKIKEGSEFNIYLPANDNLVILEQSNNELNKNNESKCGNILLMDDEETIRDVANEILSKNGFKFLSAENGDEAIRIYKEYLDQGERIDLVILDLTIPGGLGGNETLNELKKLDPDVKAIVSSGYSNNHVMSEYKKYGFVNYLEKPYRAEDLINIVTNEINPNISAYIKLL
ncbi:MAG: response regulator [Candidatus Dadabacteria bacterium]|nr:response regulator [Candidatus Dadabacteria bacterium]NIQ14014.1 response regulator [Candidatus Dadabacteria bacterium]